MYMKKITLTLAIVYSAVSLWWTYRFFTNLPQIAEQAQWLTVCDVLSLIGFWALSIFHWVIFATNRKQHKDKNEK